MTESITACAAPRSDLTVQRILRYKDTHPDDMGPYADMLTVIQSKLGSDVPGEGGRELPDDPLPEQKAAWHAFNRDFRTEILQASKRLMAAKQYGLMGDIETAYRRSLFLDSRVDFDAYMLYIEMDREPKKRFYQPRRKVLKQIAGDLQQLAGGKLSLLAISLPPGVGKTSMAIFFLSWLGGRNPNSPILTFSHDAGIVHGMYEEILRIIRPGEYLWNDVFPEISIAGTNAKDLRIDLDRPKRFQTYQFSSVGAGNAGKLRAAQLLYCDDLVEGVEQAMSKDRMDKLWTQYNTDMQQRKTGECKELHIATRWSVWDVIGRLQRQAEEEHAADKKFIVIPALDENDESNFDYPGIHDKFTTEFYHQQRDNMDPVNWKALYMNEPIEREGQLYDAEQLRRFYELPDGEPDAIVAVCDTKDKGTNYAFMPIAYMYGEDLFIVDCVCDNGDPLLVDERLAEMLKKHKVHSCQFESNSAGGKTAEKVQNRVRELGGRTTVTTKWTSGNKETKIIVNSPYVKEHCLFLDGSKYAANSDYGRMMSMLTGYTMAGRNKYDDVPDGMAMLALYVQSIGGLRVEVFRRPW